MGKGHNLAFALDSDAEEAGYGKQEPKAKQILLIEDNKSDVAYIKHMLKNIHHCGSYTLTDVPRIALALEKLGAQHFDLILLDLNLLDIDGLPAVSMIQHAAPQCPMIVYSGATDPFLKRSVIQGGARYFLVKGDTPPLVFKLTVDQALCLQASY